MTSNGAPTADSIASSSFLIIRARFKTLDTTPFEDFCETLKKHIFTANKKLDNNDMIGVPNYKDPFILSLNLAVENNHSTLNKIADYIFKYLIHQILSSYRIFICPVPANVTLPAKRKYSHLTFHKNIT